MAKLFHSRSKCIFVLSLAFLIVAIFSSSSLAEKYRPMRSEIIKAYMYDEGSQVLTIYFLNGTMHEYTSVPEMLYKGLKDAPLKGGYFTTWIQGKYEQTSTPAKTKGVAKETENSE